MAFMAEYNRRYGIQNKKSQHVALAPLEAQWSILDPDIRSLNVCNAYIEHYIDSNSFPDHL